MKDYQYYNANPLGDIESDCVTRAITEATGLSYYEVQHKLSLMAQLYECDTLCVCCYHNLLDNVFRFKNYKANGRTVKELAKQFKDDILLIRIQGHLTISKYGTVYDIWDCGNEIADVFWLVPKNYKSSTGD